MRVGAYFNVAECLRAVARVPSEDGGVYRRVLCLVVLERVRWLVCVCDAERGRLEVSLGVDNVKNRIIPFCVVKLTGCSSVINTENVFSGRE